LKTLTLTIYILTLLSCKSSTHEKTNSNCNNRIEISELGIDFCLPDSNWTVEKSSGVRIFTKENDTVYKSDIQLIIKMDLFTQDLGSEWYRDEQLNEYLTNPKMTAELISKGSESIDVRTFYYSEIKIKMRKKEKELDMYSYTMFFMDNKIGYSLDAIVLDNDYKLFDKKKILSIWQTLKINGKPDLKEITRQ
jgi:hypothetical protein